MIKETKLEDIDDIVRMRIDCLEKYSDNDVSNIGYQVDYNPKYYIVTDDSSLYDYNVLCMYGGYIPRNIKITYGITNNTSSGLVYNEGCYYYLDDDSYIIDFCKFIKNADVLDEYDLFDYLLLFLENYFGYFKDMSRSDMFKMILKENGLFYSPIAEHKFSSFKKRGNAVCSEYSIAAQNILSIFGFDMHMVFGYQTKTGSESDNHAFNFISFEEEDSNNIVNALIDFSNSSLVLNTNFEKVCRSPFIGYIDCIDDEFISGFINNDICLEFNDYNYMLFPNSVMKVTNDLKRIYSMDNIKQKVIKR